MLLTEYNPSPKPHDEAEGNSTLHNGLWRLLTPSSNLKNDSKQLMPHHNNQEVVLTFSGHDYTSLQGKMITEVNYNSWKGFLA